jgi:phosphomannomutase
LAFVRPPDPDIFKAYDIRGIYGEQLDGDLAERIARAFAHVLAGLRGKAIGDLRVGIAHDMRLTAPEMASRYREGLLGEGVHVMDAGEAATEMLYFLVGSRALDGGLMCTASHNPKPYTGAKLLREGALALSGDAGIQDVRRLVETGTPPGSERPRGTLEAVDVRVGFREAVLQFINPDVVRAGARGLKLVVDGGNGMAGPMMGPLLDELGFKPVELYFKPDGHFPDHEPNPLLEQNRRLIVDRVRAENADLGIAWDGDADRCFFIDDSGEFVAGDFLTALLARALLEKAPAPGEAVLYDVRASRAVPDTVADAGGVAFVNRVGHAFFKTRMREQGSLFGGEVSGHYYFRDFYCADSGTIPALLVLELLCRERRKLSELLAPYRQRYFISGEINSQVSDPNAKLEEIAERYSDARQGRLDGISIDYDDWHFNVRPSNTEPLLRLNLESLVSEQDMQRRRDEVLALIRA